jgi:hypothetical protein
MVLYVDLAGKPMTILGDKRNKNREIEDIKWKGGRKTRYVLHG